MKLHIIGPEITSLEKVKNFTGIQAYYIRRELLNRGVELEFDRLAYALRGEPLVQYYSELPSIKADHVLALGLRYFTHAPRMCGDILKTKVKGKVTQMHDGAIFNSSADCTFTFRDDTQRYADAPSPFDPYKDRINHYVGWADDPEMLLSKQDEKVLQILVDHPMYKLGFADYTLNILNACRDFVKGRVWESRYEDVVIKAIVDGGIETVDIDRINVRPFSRMHIPFTVVAEEYARSHVFMPTHHESVGLTALETAVCGALVVTQPPFIPRDRLATFRYVDYGRYVDWYRVMDSINPEKSRKVASNNSWSSLVDKMMDYFDAHKP